MLSPKRVFFYCLPIAAPDQVGYHHLMLAIAEGLKPLGVQLYSNINYWKASPDSDEYLIIHDPDVTPDDCDVVMIDEHWLITGPGELPPQLFKPHRNYITVYLDNSESTKCIRKQSWSQEFSQFDLILRTHCSTQFEYPQNFRPWTFSLPQRVLDEVSDIPSYDERNHHLLVNFRDTQWMHSVRKSVYHSLHPYIESKLAPVYKAVNDFNAPPTSEYHYFQWLQTGRRHYPDYYNNLKTSAFCSCFGGFFVPSHIKHPGTRWAEIQKRLFTELGWSSKSILQWDSWRFWESLAAGAVSLHVDFEKYGFSLPVMPKNWVHYIGLDLDHVQDDIDRMIDEPGILADISRQGREWALTHYTSKAVALRFLDVLENYQSQSVVQEVVPV